VDVARPELGREAVALRVEHEEGVIADRLEVAVVRRLLLGAVNWALGAVDVDGHASGPGRCALHQLRIETREPLVVPFLRDVRLEPMECRGKRDARLPPLARGQHPKRRVLGQPFGVVGVLVARQAAVDRLAEQVRHRKLPVVSGARVR